MMHPTPRERASRLWRWSLGIFALGLAVLAVGAFAPVPDGGFALALSLVAPLLFVATVLLGAIAVNLSTRQPELVWMVAGILVFWVANSAVYLHLVRRANTLPANVPSQELINLVSTLFVAGVIAIIAAALLGVLGWFVRPGRWHALNGPSGQS